MWLSSSSGSVYYDEKERAPVEFSAMEQAEAGDVLIGHLLSESQNTINHAPGEDYAYRGY